MNEEHPDRWDLADLFRPARTGPSTQARAEGKAPSEAGLLGRVAGEVRETAAETEGLLEALRSDVERPLSDAQRTRLESALALQRNLANLVAHGAQGDQPGAGRIAVQRRIVSGAELTASAMALRGLAEHKGVRLVNEIPPTMRLDADPVLLGQVLHNLVRQALARCRGGESVALSVLPGRSPIIAVRDNAEPAAGGTLAPLPPAGGQPGPPDAPEEPGEGLALAVSRAIMRAHGGSLHLEPAQGRGTVCLIMLPKYHPDVLDVKDEEIDKALSRHLPD
jgi:signal transduction histidine kinase